MENKVTRLIVLLLTIPIILGVSDLLNMYTFNKTADKAFLLLGFVLALFVLIYSVMLLIKAVKKHERNKVIECTVLTIYSFMYSIIIWLTYVLPYCYIFEL